MVHWSLPCIDHLIQQSKKKDMRRVTRREGKEINEEYDEYLMLLDTLVHVA